MKTAHQLAAALASGETTSRALVESSFEAIHRLEGTLHSFITTTEAEALAAADASDARRRAGSPLSPLDGMPIAIKDNICTKGVKTTCASKMLANFVPPYDATVTARLRERGLVCVGKTNLDEFAMGSSTEHSAFGRSSNPWNPACVPGGSSGGSAAAVAGGEVPWALGSDTGGSIRQPASLCGIVGIKPTYGLVSRYGLVAFASSLDQIGPMTLDVEDAALLLDAIAGPDHMDSTSAPKQPSGFHAALEGATSLKGMRIARPREFFPETGITSDVRDSVNAAVEKARELGAEIIDVTMPHTEYAISTYYLVATAEASSNLARYDGAQYGFRVKGTKNVVDMFSQSRSQGLGREVKRRIMMGTHALSAGYFDAYYLKALKVRTLIKRDYDEAFAKADLIIGPTAPDVAFEAGAKSADPMAMYLCDIFTISLNLAGYCGLSMPCGFSGSGMPIGLQLFAGAFQEQKLLRAAKALEGALGVVGSRSPKL